jgi:hypothetical protein
VLAPVGKSDAGADNKGRHRPRDKHLAWACRRSDSGADVDSQPGHIGAPHFDLASVQSGPHFDTQRPNRFTNGACTLNGPSRPVEGGEEPVADGVDFPPTESFKFSTDGPIMGVEQIAPLRSPTSAARSVDATMSVNMTVASTRSVA